MDDQSYRLDDPRRRWISTDSTDQQVLVSIRGTMRVHDLTTYLAEQGVELHAATITFATVSWTEPASAEALEQRRHHERKRQERTDEWERRMYATLYAKFGGAPPKTPAEGPDHTDGEPT